MRRGSREPGLRTALHSTGSPSKRGQPRPGQSRAAGCRGRRPGLGWAGPAAPPSRPPEGARRPSLPAPSRAALQVGACGGAERRPTVRRSARNGGSGGPGGGGGRSGPGGAGPGKGPGQQHRRAGQSAAPGPRVRQRGPALPPSAPAGTRGDLAAAARPRLYRSTALLPLRRPMALHSFAGAWPLYAFFVVYFFLEKCFNLLRVVS